MENTQFWHKNVNKMNFCPRDFNDSMIFGVAAHDLYNHEIEIWSHHNICILLWQPW